MIFILHIINNYTELFINKIIKQLFSMLCNLLKIVRNINVDQWYSKFLKAVHPNLLRNKFCAH